MGGPGASDTHLPKGLVPEIQACENITFLQLRWRVVDILEPIDPGPILGLGPVQCE